MNISLKNTLLKWIQPLAFLTAVSAGAQPITYNFNDYDAFSNDVFSTSGDFTQSTTSSFDLFTRSGSAFALQDGANTEVGVRSPQGANSRFALVAAAGQVGFFTGSDAAFSQSVFFHTADDFSGLTNDGEDVVMLGLTDQLTQGSPINGVRGLDKIFLNSAVRVTDASAGTFKFAGAVKVAGVGVSEGTASGTLATDSWYRYSVDYNYATATNEWTMVSSVYLANNDGSVTALSPIAQDTIVLSNLDVFADGSSFAGVFSAEGSKTAGVVSFDELTLVAVPMVAAVPEPSTYALISALLALGWIMIRRRK